MSERTGRENWRFDTIAVHGGYSPEPTTRAAAVPIYQTVAYAFDNAQHGADLFDLKVPGNIYTRIMNPTQDVLEQRVAALEGGIAALALASGQAAVTYAIQTIAEAGDNIVAASACTAAPTTCSRTRCRNSASRRASPITATRTRFEPLIDAKTKAVFVESLGNPAGQRHRHRADRRNRPSPWRAADRRQHRAHALSEPADRARRRHRGAFADQVPGRPRHEHRRRDRRLGQVPVGAAQRTLQAANEPDVSYHGVVYTEALGLLPTSAVRASCRCAIPAPRSRRSTRS